MDIYFLISLNKYKMPKALVTEWFFDPIFVFVYLYGWLIYWIRYCLHWPIDEDILTSDRTPNTTDMVGSCPNTHFKSYPDFRKCVSPVSMLYLYGFPISLVLTVEKYRNLLVAEWESICKCLILVRFTRQISPCSFGY